MPLPTADKLTPQIAVVVLSYRLRRTLVEAVRSICEQEVPAEIVVVHSGGGDARATLAAAGLDVRVVSSATRLFPGGARNLGIVETKAPIVAFLADDCTASTGWLRERLLAHEGGARAVASALLCHQPHNPVAVAAHLSLFVRRMPRARPAVALAYGASYARSLFQHYGNFREDIEGGEDTDFNQRLAPADKPVWAPQVRTTHMGADTLGAFLRGQFARGRRIARAWREMGAFSSRGVAKNALARTGLVIGEGWENTESRERWVVVLAIPFIALGNIVYACGALSAGR